MKKIPLALLIACLMLLSLAACVDTSRQPITAKDELTGVYTVELWSEHEFYEFGEPVNLRATLTNVSTNTITFGGKRDTTPALDINVKTPGGGGSEERIWSKENSDRVKYALTLAPHESYIITWTLSLSFRTTYIVETSWVDPREGERFRTGMNILYGERLPSP